MKLSDQDRAMIDGEHGAGKQIAMKGLVQLGEAFDAEDLVDIGYAHVHAGMAMYLGDVELIEELAALGARMAVPASSNVANADMENWKATGAPERLVRLQQRAEGAHKSMGTSCSFTCTPYWAGHWPTWNTHMTSIESGVTVFCNSVLGARSNRDGFFAVYAGITGRYPRFGLHLDAHRRPTHRVKIEANPQDTSDFTALGYAIGLQVMDGIPLLDGLKRRPTLDELDGLGVGLATSGGVSMFILPGVTPPFSSVEHALNGVGNIPDVCVRQREVAGIYDYFCSGDHNDIEIVHMGCPHASYEEMKCYAELLDGKTIHDGVELWVTTSRTVRRMAADAGLVAKIEASGAKVIADTCPISCHFARSASPDPSLGVKPPKMRTVVVDSAKQAKYVRDMIRCETLFTNTENAVETAVRGQFVPRY